MKKLAIYSLIVLSMQMLFNCKKYPEGGCERRGPKLIIGDWRLSLYEVNGIDSTDLINYNGNDSYKIIKIYKDGGVFQIDQKSSIGNSVSFSNGNKNLKINGQPTSSGQKCILDAGVNYCFRLFFTPENIATDWEIQKLTKNELVIIASLNNSYKIKLNK